MVKQELFDAALSSVEKVYKLSEQKFEKTRDKRFAVLKELARKIRVSFNAIHFIPYEQYEVLYPSINLLFRSVIVDLTTSLLLLLVKDEQLDDFLLIDNLKFFESFKSALETEVEIRKHFYPQNAEEYENLKTKYQIDLYDDLKDCLKSTKDAPWEKKERPNLEINNIRYTGQIKEVFQILKTTEELYGYTYLYKHYRLLSQSEHFSMKGSFFNYKNDFHDECYNKILGFVYLGEKLIYDKYEDQ